VAQLPNWGPGCLLGEIYRSHTIRYPHSPQESPEPVEQQLPQQHRLQSKGRETVPQTTRPPRSAIRQFLVSEMTFVSFNSKRSLMIIICVQRECNGVAVEVTYLNTQSLSLLERTEANHAVPDLLTVHAAFSRLTSRALQSSVSPAKFKSRSGDPLLCLFIVSLVQGKFGTRCEIRLRRLISTPSSVLYLPIMLSFDAIGYHVYWPPDSRQTNHRHEYFSEIVFVQLQKYSRRTALFDSL